MKTNMSKRLRKWFDPASFGTATRSAFRMDDTPSPAHHQAPSGARTAIFWPMISVASHPKINFAARFQEVISSASLTATTAGIAGVEEMKDYVAFFETFLPPCYRSRRRESSTQSFCRTYLENSFPSNNSSPGFGHLQLSEIGPFGQP